MKTTLTLLFTIISLASFGQITIIRPDTIEPLNMNVVNGKILYFHNSNPGQWQYELWVTDGTNAGTHLVKDINPNSPDDLFNWFSSCGVQRYSSYVFNNELYFLADDGVHGMEIWKSDGTAPGTNMLIELTPGLMGWDFTDCKTPGFCECNGTLYFNAGNSTDGYELWKSDGTTAGTVQVKDIYPGTTGSNPHFITSLNGKVYFTAKDAVNGWELFSSDGTPGGTGVVKDIVPGINGAFNDGADNSINPQFRVCGNYLYFQADNDGLTPVSSHWWRTDGTSAGTIQLENNLTAQSTGPYNFVVTTADLNGQFVFIASGGSTNSNFWRSDGTPAGTIEISTNNGLSMRPGIIGLGNYVYFNGSDNDSSGLARSDGTTNGTDMVFGYVESGSAFNVEQMMNFNSNTFFHITKYYGMNGAHQRVAQTNGTRAGTIIYPDVEPLSKLIPLGNDLIFYGHDTTEAVPQYTKLYRLHPDSIPPAIGVGMNEINRDLSFEVYPSPASSKVTIRATGFKGASLEIKIMDLTGRIILKQRSSFEPDAFATIDLPENISDGLYLMTVTNVTGEFKTASFVIQRH